METIKILLHLYICICLFTFATFVYFEYTIKVYLASYGLRRLPFTAKGIARRALMFTVLSVLPIVNIYFTVDRLRLARPTAEKLLNNHNKRHGGMGE